MEKRSRKRSRKVSERDEASEELSPPPPPKSTRRSSGGKGGDEEVKKGRGASGRSSRRKGLRVSFDILENQLNVGEGEGTGRDRPSKSPTSETAPSLASEISDNRHSRVAKDFPAPPHDRPKTVELKFKNPKFTFSFFTGNKKKSWRGFKQIVAAERTLQWKPTDPNFSSLDAPPPLKPAKKYSDLSGLEGKYKDPMSGLLYHSSEEFRTIRSLPPDIVTGYLALRGKQPIM